METPSVEKVEKRNTTYLLPTELARRIRREAADSDRWPAEVVAEACEIYLSGRRSERSDRLASV